MYKIGADSKPAVSGKRPRLLSKDKGSTGITGIAVENYLEARLMTVRSYVLFSSSLRR